MPQITHAQTVELSTVSSGVKDGDLGSIIVNIPYDPSVHVAYKTTTSPFVTAISPYITLNHPDWIAAIQNAVAAWAQILSTTHSVTITFSSTAEGSSYALPSDFLARVKPINDIANFTPAGGSLAYFGNTFYVAPLACFISNGAVGSGGVSNINVVINENYAPIHGGFNTNIDNTIPCPSDKYDLMTVCMQAMGSGFGVVSETNAFGFAHTNQWPNIFEHFINDNGTGRSGHAITYLKDLGPTPTFLGSFITGGGSYATDHTFNNNAYFKGPTTPLTQLYIPGIFESGRNLCYIDPSTNLTLMNPNLPTGKKVHVPSPIEIKMLNDIGWNASTATVGSMDDITITTPYSTNPATILNIGSIYTYHATDPGGYYGINPLTGSFTLKLLDETGYVMCDNQTAGGGLAWTTSPITLPSGAHKWVRDINGNIQGILTASGNENAGYGGTMASLITSIDIGVQTPPDEPIFRVTNVADYSGCCATKTLKFYAAGSDHFQVFSREFVDGVWDSWSVSIPETGDQSFTFSGLDETISHQFYVMAYNSLGYSTSQTVTTYPCVYKITPFPNPALHANNLHLQADQSFLISEVNFVNSQTGQSVVKIPFDGKNSAVDIDLSKYYLDQGLYNVTVTAATLFNPDNCNKVSNGNDNIISSLVEIR